MKKTVLIAFMVSIFGTSAALAECEYAYPGCTNCSPRANNYRATRIFFGLACSFCAVHRCSSTSYKCQDNDILQVSEEDKKVSDKVDEILRELGPEIMKISTEKNILFEVAESNPYAVIGLHGIYVGSGTIPVKSTIWAKGDPDKKLNSQKVKELLTSFYNNEIPKEEEYELKEDGTKTRIDHELRKTSDNAAYMNIEVSTADADDREISKILPNIRIHLKWMKNSDGTGQWEPTDWQAY